MTLTTIFIYVGIAAVIFTALTILLYSKGILVFPHPGTKTAAVTREDIDNRYTPVRYVMTFLQSFLGIFFIFSGLVKAIDPLGTAYKMEQYFAQFELVADGSIFSFMSGLFPLMSSFSVAFATFMIVLELVLGFTILFGIWKRLSSWLFFIILFFFTILTGFTHLTGYVPDGVNFFEFGKWGEFVKSQRKVTDCGCFGDFLKLDPFVSFVKDLILISLGFILLIFNKSMHQYFKGAAGGLLALVITGISLLFCLNNFVWDLPVKDFRPFAEGVNIQASKAAEEEKLANAPMYFIYKNLETGQNEQFDMKNLPKDKTKFEYVDRIQEEVETKKTADFYLSGFKTITDSTGTQTFEEDVTEDFFATQGYHFVIVNASREKANADAFQTTVATLQSEAEAAKIPFLGLTHVGSYEEVESFRHDMQAAFPFYTADDILLKTIVRSNPGILLMNGPTIVKKWHHNKVPNFETIQKEHIK